MAQGKSCVFFNDMTPPKGFIPWNKIGKTKDCLSCGKQFYATPSDEKIGKAKYCSVACFHKFRKGIPNTKLSELYKGKHKDWLASIRPDIRDEKHPQWKGDDVSYTGLHQWVSRKRGKAIWCTFCGSCINVQWANISGEYKRDLRDWLELCAKCHANFDRYIDKTWVTRKGGATFLQ